MAEEDLMKEENVLAQVESGEKFLRREEEVVELPPNVQNLQIKLERIRGEISTLQTRFDSVREELDTRIAAFNWFNEKLQATLNSE
jgi:peptidoglycan hydrolase CwlO-like protein